MVTFTEGIINGKLHFLCSSFYSSNILSLMRSRFFQRGEESYITVQQDCSASSFIKAQMMLLSTALFLTQFIL